MRIVVAGSYKYRFYDEACAFALERIGCDVIRFAWQRYYGKGLLGRLQRRLLFGPGILRLNKELLRVSLDSNPDVVFVTRGSAIWPSTLQAIKKRSRALLVSYNNDDPFGGDRGKRLWKHFVASIPFYDVHFVYRPQNTSEYKSCGAEHVHILKPFYVPELHYAPTLSKEDRRSFECDVVFVGHPEPNRVHHIDALGRTGLSLKVYGPGWQTIAEQREWAGFCHPPIYGDGYVRAIGAAKIALSFFCRKNRDLYTRRVYEIPAIGTCMLSERSKEMLNMFREDKEAVYFSTPDELVTQAVRLTQDKKRSLAIAESGHRRVQDIGGSVDDRMQQWFSIVSGYIA